MKPGTFFVATRLIAVMILFSINSCTSVAMKGYEGPDLSADKTAIVEAGVYLDIEKCDGVKLSSLQDRVIVLPGDHTIEMTFATQYRGNSVVYSREAASVTFRTEAGHTYVAYAHMILNREWTANIRDKKTDELVAQSKPLPLIETLVRSE
jgi:hypothetical protein